VASANGPELLTSTVAPTGLRKHSAIPCRVFAKDFGTARIDQTFTSADSFAGFTLWTTVKAHSPTNNPLSLVDIFLREQVISLSETHVFSPSLLNRATFGFSRGRFYFQRRNDSECCPAGAMPASPSARLWWAGGTTLNGASQITNGGTNAGSNLTAARNLYTASDQVTFSRGNHLFTFGGWLQRLQDNDILGPRPVRTGFLHHLQTFLQGKVSTYTYAPSYTPLAWRSLESAFYLEDAIKLRPSLELRIGLSGRVHKRVERGSRTRGELRV